MKYEERTADKCKKISFYFPFEIEPKQSVRKGKRKDGTDVFYKDPKHVAFEKKVQINALSQLKRTELTGPIFYSAEYAFEVPKSYPKKIKDIVKSGRRFPKITKPDLTDNLNKGLIDAISPLYFKNDSMISSVRLEKFYSEKSYIKCSFTELPTV